MSKDGGSAFPAQSISLRHAEQGVEAYELHGGMSLRDYFAAKAMASILADIGLRSLENEVRPQMGRLAQVAYAMADAMLKAKDS
jgi:hypothetical protein